MGTKRAEPDEPLAMGFAGQVLRANGARARFVWPDGSPSIPAEAIQIEWSGPAWIMPQQARRVADLV